MNTYLKQIIISGRRFPLLFLFLIVTIFASGLTNALMAQPETANPGVQAELDKARSYLTKDLETVREEFEKLSEKEAAVLITQLLHVTRKTNPDVDKVYELLKHLETLRATAQAQNRLNNLLTVLGFTLVLFTLFLIYVVFDQYRNFKKLREHLASDTGVNGSNNPDTKTASNVYRGE